MKKKLYLLITLLCCSCKQSPTSSEKIQDIDIIFQNQSVEEVTGFVGEEIQLHLLANVQDLPEVNWEISDETIATISQSGKLSILNKGNAIITATLKDYPYINDSIFLKASEKIEQKGVGTGTKDNPIFLGNEGEDEPIEVYFIEMQHIYADSIFIKKGNVEVLIDAGYAYDGKFINQFLKEKVTDSRLDALMVSHSDGDHIDGIHNALQGLENISLMVDYGGTGSGNVLEARNTYRPKGMQYFSAYDCVNGLNGAKDRYYFTSDFYVDILNTGSYITSDKTSASNPSSLAVLFTYKDFTFFSAGDITEATETKLLDNENLPEVTLYKASHHGSHGSNSQEILNELNPKAIAISAARANRYGVEPTGPTKENTYNLNGVSGHPAAAAIERFYKAPKISQNLNVYWNAVNGTMKFTSYGEDDFTFTGSIPMKGYYDLSLTDGEAVWNEEKQDFENKVTGEENLKLHQTKIFQFRNYNAYLPEWVLQ